MNPEGVLQFWFEDIDESLHFVKSEEVDKQINERFGTLHTEIVSGKHIEWAETPEGALALIIVLDQFSRNLFRDSGESFSQDELALQLAEGAVEKGFDQELPQEKRLFMYMPYMHSESKDVHERAIPLFESLGMEGTLRYEHIHKDIIDQFGRYPHRNEVLGRESTHEEIEYLNNKSESFF